MAIDHWSPLADIGNAYELPKALGMKEIHFSIVKDTREVFLEIIIRGLEL